MKAYAAAAAAAGRRLLQLAQPAPPTGVPCPGQLRPGKSYNESSGQRSAYRVAHSSPHHATCAQPERACMLMALLRCIDILQRALGGPHSPQGAAARSHPPRESLPSQPWCLAFASCAGVEETCEKGRRGQGPRLWSVRWQDPNLPICAVSWFQKTNMTNSARARFVAIV